MGTTELEAALSGHGRLAVDTAPLVYFLVDAPRRAALTERVLQLAAAGRLQLVVSCITEAELLVGPLRADSAAGEQAIAGLLDGPAGFDVVEMTRVIARRAAALRAKHGLRLADAAVAATALESGCSGILGNDTVMRRLNGITYLHLDDFV